MTFTSASLPAAETAARADGKPRLMGNSAGERGNLFPIWTTGGLATDNDASAIGYEAWRAFDRAAVDRTRPSAAGTSWYLVFQIARSTSFDTLVGLNFVQPAQATLSLEIANDSAFSSGLVSLFSGFQPSGSRFTYALASRYTGTGFARLRITFAAAQLPELGELWLGQARVLRRGPETPHDERRVETRRRTAGADTSHPIDVTEYQGRARLEARIRAWDADSLDDAASWRSFMLDCAAGAKPGLYLRDPAGSPSGWGLFALDPGARAPIVANPGIRAFEIRGLELPPFLSAEGL